MSIKPNPYESIRRISEVASNRQGHCKQCVRKAASGEYADIWEAIRSCADIGAEYVGFYVPDSPKVISNLTTLRADGFTVNWSKVDDKLYVHIVIP